MHLRTDDVAVVTGAASGIGLALARAFCARGLAVVMADVRSDRLVAAATVLRGQGGDVATAVADVSRAGDVERLADRAVAAYGRVDVVCNNAGVSPPPSTAWAGSVEAWRWSLDVGLLGVVHGIRSFVPAMVACGRGHVLNTASVGGLVPVPGLAPYVAVKHAVIGLTETLAAELAELAPGVGASVLCPGVVTTDLTRSSRESAPAGVNPASGRGDVPTVPRLGSVLDPAAVAEMALAGIEADLLRIVTHRDSASLVRRRLASIAADLPD
nr:SDR family NAD(P)-dependent oxidoreductase [Rhodococcus wratislaviensis]GLK34144.1 short-chain type dehydrogenase/reductase [Rhodococcus wratislaviensis]